MVLKTHVTVYDTRFKIYRDGHIKIKNYSKTITKDKQEDTSIVTLGRVSTDSLKYESVRSDSLYRSRDLLIDYALANPIWNTFITLTFKDEISSIEDANRKFNVWRASFSRLCKKYNYDLKYLGVPEFQKNGRVHYHLLTNIPCGSTLIPLREPIKLFNKDTKKYTYLEYYDLSCWSYGFSSAFNLQNTDENFNVALYITKYLYKDIDTRLYGHTRVLKSNNLLKPNTYLLLTTDERYQQAMNYIKNKKYDIKRVSFTEPTEDNPYIIPSLNFDYFLQEDNNTINDILQ